MKEPTGSDSQKCPIAFALDTFGDKWSLLVIRDILFKGKQYYGEFLKADEKISTNILANRLSKLEAEGLLLKTRDPQHMSRYIYSLTSKGIDLLPIILEMIEWSVKYDPQPDVPDNIISGAPANLLQRSHDDRAGLIAEIVAKL